ncbi:MAG: hypothetical protein M1831_000147 [Alyxoria varia]|nr:MAG: hypothetical protein M1831_000147 [Alyxoria varia]
MSANLLADLDSFYQPPSSNNNAKPAPNDQTQAPSFPWRAKPSRDSSTSPTNQGTNLPVDDDDFGDFEDAQVQQPKPRIFEELTRSSNQPVTQPQLGRQDSQKRTSKINKPKDDNVLFDAEDELEDQGEDGFGDFEGADKSSPPHVALKQPSLPKSAPEPQSLIDFDNDFSSSAPRKHKPSSTPPQRPHKNQLYSKEALVGASGLGFGVLGPTTLNDSKSPDDALADQEVEDPWADFEPVQEIAPPNVRSSTEHTGLDHTITGNQAAEDKTDMPSLRLEDLLAHLEISTASGAPTNIPPPAVILSLFPSIFSTAQEQLFDPLAQQASQAATRNATLSSPKVRQYLSSLLAVATVMGHVIAGRKNRWKRDTILAQSMRIGPASASGKSGGMKLTGVDRAEGAREDREAADAIRAFRNQLGRLRSVLTASGGFGAVPDVVESLMVRAARPSEGAITSVKPCALCGLKRNERVQKIDFDVQDSFGEWWVEYWGHKICMNFWEKQKNNLKAR